MSLCVVDKDDLRSTKDSHSDDVLHESSGFVKPIDISYKLQAIVRHIGREAFAGHYVCDVSSEISVNGCTETVWKRHDDALVTGQCLP